MHTHFDQDAYTHQTQEDALQCNMGVFLGNYNMYLKGNPEL